MAYESSNRAPFYCALSDFFDDETPVIKHEGTNSIESFQTSSDIWIKSVDSKDVRESLDEVSSYLRYVLDEIPLDAAKRLP